jgi:hypothetical protein
VQGSRVLSICSMLKCSTAGIELDVEAGAV